MWKVIAGVVGFVLMLLVSFAVAARLEDWWGQPAVIAMTCALAFGAAWTATPEAKAMADRVRRALLRIDLGKEAAALTMRIDASLFSRWLQCKEQASLSRLAELGDDFAVAFALEILNDVGGYTVFHNDHLARMVTAVETIADSVAPRRAAVA